jgi:hypothetical protein
MPHPTADTPRDDPVRVDAYVLDVLLPDLVGHDRRPSALLVYLVLWRRSRGGRVPAAASLAALAEASGLSKRAVQLALATLRRRRLVSADRASATAVPEYRVLRPWARDVR